MSARTRAIGCAVGVVFVAMALAAAAVTPDGPQDLRVYVVQAQVFPYLLSGVATGADGRPALTFRDLTGNSWCVGVGGRLDGWTVTAHTSRTERVFNATVNATLARDTSEVTLTNTSGQRRVLTLGTALEEPGRMACFVELSTGQFQHARPGDALTLGGGAWIVSAVGESNALLRAAQAVYPVALASDPERQSVVALWQRQREQAEAAARAQAAAAATRPVVAAARPAPNVAAPSHPSRFALGSEYRYPVEYDVYPVAVRMPDGSIRMQGIVVPTRFTTRSVGFGLDAR